MDKHKFSVIGAVLAAVAMVAGGWFFGIQPQLASASTDDTQRSTIEATNQDNRVVLQQLEQEFTELDASKSTLEQLRRSVPATADTAGFTRQVDDAVSGSGATLTSLTFGALQAYAPTSTDGGTSGDGGTPTDAATATSAPAAAPSAPPTPAAPQPYRNPQITSSTFDMMPVTVAVDVSSYHQALDLAGRLQHGDRLFLVDSLSQTAKEATVGSQSWSLAGYVYVVHAESATATATATEAAGEATPASSAAPAAG
ncbi:hypothetical protein [Curtobacterium sp. VKM Ac-2922]|uniref:hypothetical protein n=1 Tax=Curtobacterium sp. VKM Ac-2922 TaxID=2929475 RepID=UPI001FB1D415|nr:hypothetical protein [Curtobacterium sp. VKM Ac-2922]MCJ1715662.1 hypothetical protein [Curtobacterium sp. VKM Ac-2922]